MAQMHREHIVNAGQKLSNTVGSPQVSLGSQNKPSRAAGNDENIGRTMVHKYHLRPIHHNDNSRWDNKCRWFKVAMEGQKLTRTLDVNATQMQPKRIRGSLALKCFIRLHLSWKFIYYLILFSLRVSNHLMWL